MPAAIWVWEIPAEEVPYLQKMLIQKCNSNFKTVITATQMLDSMMRKPAPDKSGSDRRCKCGV